MPTKTEAEFARVSRLNASVRAYEESPMDQLWRGPAVQWTVWGILMALVMGWVARSRFKTRPRSDSQRLVHPPSTLIIGVVVFLFFAGIAIISNVFPNKTVTWWRTGVFVGFALLSLGMVAAYCLGHHQVSGEGLSYGRLTGRRVYLEWQISVE